MADPQDMILVLPREMRRENADGFASGDRGLEKLEEAGESFGQALSAEWPPSKLVAGEFAQRIVALENKMRELESQK